MGARIHAGRLLKVACSLSAVAVVAVATVGLTSASADPVVKVTTSKTGDIRVGETFDVQVVADSIAEGSGFGGFSYDVIFDDQAVTTVEGSELDCPYDMSTVLKPRLGLSPFHQACIYLPLSDSGQSGVVTLSKMVFMCLKPGRATIGLDQPLLVLGGEAAQGLSVQGLYLSVNCVASDSGPAPTAVPTDTPDPMKPPTVVPPTAMPDGTVITATPAPPTPVPTGAYATAQQRAVATEAAATVAAGGSDPRTPPPSDATAASATTAAGQGKTTPAATAAAGTSSGKAQAQGANGTAETNDDGSDNGWLLWVVVAVIAVVVAAGAYAYTRLSRGKGGS